MTIIQGKSVSELTNLNVRDSLFVKNVRVDFLGVSNVYTVTSLQDILDINGVELNGTDIDMTALGSFTLKPRGSIDISPNRILCDGDTSGIVLIDGENQDNDIMITNHTNGLFKFIDCTLLVRWMNFFAVASTVGVFDISNSAGQKKKNSFQMFNTFINDSIGGTFADLDTVSIFLPSFVGGSTYGFIFNGEFTRGVIQDTQFIGISGDMINIVGATFDSFSVANSVINSNGSNVFIRGDAGSANINSGGSATVTNVRNEGSTPIIIGVTIKDLQWTFTANPGFQNTQFIGNTNITTPVDTAFLDSTFIKVLGTTTEFSDNSHFSQSANNEIEYIGLESRDVKITVNLSAKRASGAGSTDVIFSVFKNTGSGFSAVDSNTDSPTDIDNKSRPAVILVRDFANTGDKYSVYVSQPSSLITMSVPKLQLDIEAN